jgi:outer membrane protein TolC
VTNKHDISSNFLFPNSRYFVIIVMTKQCKNSVVILSPISAQMSQQKTAFQTRKVFMLLCLVIICAMTSLKAQSQASLNVPRLTLQECVRIAREESPLGVAARRDYESALFDYRAFEASMLPQFSLNGTAPNFIQSINPITQPDGTVQFLPQSQMLSNLSLTVSQRVPFSGGDIFVSSGLNRIDLLGDRPTALWQSVPFQIGLRQPVFQFNQYAFEQQSRALQRTIAERQYIETLENLSMSITNAFFDAYIAGLNLENAAANSAINDTLYQLSKGRFEVGKISENELLQSELAVMNARVNIARAELTFKRAQYSLQIALGRTPEEKCFLVPPVQLPKVSVIPERARAQALANRSEAVGFDNRRLIASRTLEQARLNNGFNATLSASLGFNQTNNDLPLAYQNLLSQSRANLTFQLPILQWGLGTSQIESAKANESQVEQRIIADGLNIGQEAYFQAAELLLLEQQVVLSAKADTIGQKRFDVAKNRYIIGKIALNDFFIGQNDKDQALQNYLQTLRNYWLAYYRLRRLTLFDFERNLRLIVP